MLCFRTTGGDEKGRAHLVGTCRRQRTRQGRRGEPRRRSPNRRRQDRETERGAAIEKGTGQRTGEGRRGSPAAAAAAGGGGIGVARRHPLSWPGKRGGGEEGSGSGREQVCAAAA